MLIAGEKKQEGTEARRHEGSAVALRRKITCLQGLSETLP
jgi:hypothetical protein